MSKVEAAVQWARRGYRIFPCLPDEPGREGNAKRAKKPAWEGWTEWATTDEATIRSWWQGQEWNIGVLTTDLVVVDIDMKRDRDGMASWMQVYGGFDTLTVRTPSGGLHLYYTGANVALNQGALGAGLDIRSHHGYTLAPGSTIEGVPYRVEIDQPMAMAPGEVVSRCKPPGERAANAQTSLIEEDDPRGIALAVQAIAATPAAIDGERSQRAYELACKVRDYGISEGMCRNLMAAWGASSDVVGDDLHGRIANAYAYAQNPAGTKHPDVMFGGIVIPPVPTQQEAAAARAEQSGVRLVSAEDCATTTPRAYVVKGLIAAGQVGCIFGQPGAGKSVVAPHLAYAVAQGRRAFGQRTKPGAVFYVCAEDEAGMRQRVAALRKRHGAAPDFHLVAGVSNLLADATGDLHRLQQLVEEHRPALIVVDTLAAAAPGLDENASGEMSRVVEAMHALARHGAAVLLVHHSPKSGDTPRGHSVLNGALDVSMMVAPDAAVEGVVRGELHKNRNGPCNLNIAFRIEAAGMGQDDDGDAITAPICAELTAEDIRSERKGRLTAAAAKAGDVLQAMGRALQPPGAPADALLPAVPVMTWEDRCTEPGILSDARRLTDRRKAFNKARDDLVAKVRVRIDSGSVTYLGHGYETWGARGSGGSAAALFPPAGAIPPPPTTGTALAA